MILMQREQSKLHTPERRYNFLTDCKPSFCDKASHLNLRKRAQNSYYDIKKFKLLFMKGDFLSMSYVSTKEVASFHEMLIFSTVFFVNYVAREELVKVIEVIW